MVISIVICTFNRASSLIKTIKTLEYLRNENNVEYEILIIDNNSSDNTYNAVKALVADNANIRYIFEPNQGLSRARNRGILESKGQILAFLDDDVLVDPGWLVNVYKCFYGSSIACVGGRIYPHWEEPRPSWLGDYLYPYLALLDLGCEKMRMVEPKLWGANLIFNKMVFDKYGLFDIKFGRTAGKLYGNEEIELIQRLIHNGEEVYYMPDIIVHHCIGKNRLKKSYFRKWLFDSGELEGIQMGQYSKRNLFGIPYFVIKQLIKDGYDFVINRLLNNKDYFFKELSFFKTCGFISGRLSYYNSQKEH